MEKMVMSVTVLSLRTALISVVGLLVLAGGLLLMPQSVNAAPDTIITVAAAAVGSTMPDTLDGPVLQNGDFTIRDVGGAEATRLGDGNNENTEWTFDFTADPNWLDFQG
jgi:hypothetical protein